MPMIQPSRCATSILYRASYPALALLRGRISYVICTQGGSSSVLSFAFILHAIAHLSTTSTSHISIVLPLPLPQSISDLIHICCYLCIHLSSSSRWNVTFHTSTRWNHYVPKDTFPRCTKALCDNGFLLAASADVLQFLLIFDGVRPQRITRCHV